MNQPNWLTDCDPLQHMDIPQLKTIAEAQGFAAKLASGKASARTVNQEIVT